MIKVEVFYNKIITVAMMYLFLIASTLLIAKNESNSELMFYNNDVNETGSKEPAAFLAAIGRNLNAGIEITTAGSQYAVKIVPINVPDVTGIRNGNSIMYKISPSTNVVYTFKKNGIKEDIIFNSTEAPVVEISFKLEIDSMLEVRLDKKGNVLIYGPNAILSDFIQSGDNKSAELILKARQQAPKDNLLYIIPAPVIIDAFGKKYKGIAHYKLEKSILKLYAGGIDKIPAPIIIDPSIIVTTTADFIYGNNEGMISFDTDAISRDVQNGGSIGDWNTTNNFNIARFGHTSVVYNGYVYVIGGWSGSYCNDVQYARINDDGTVGAWNTTTSFSIGRYFHSSVVYNGYLYIIGGYSSAYLNDVQFARINPDGTLTSWASTSSFEMARFQHTSVVYNGYLYIIGGYGVSSILNNVQYAVINADGTLGTWTTTTSLASPRYGHASVAYNNFIYVMGGWSGSILNDVQFVPINTDGTLGTWLSTNSFATGRYKHSSMVYNGNLYAIGGSNGTNNLNDVQYAVINSNGTLGSWITTNSIATQRYGHTSIAYNNCIYVIGGYDGTKSLNDVLFARINQVGVVGEWKNTTAFPISRQWHTSVAYNGYLYVIGGFNGTYLDNVQFAPINDDGTIGNWTFTTPLAGGRAQHSSVVYNGFLYVIGGFNGVTMKNDVQFAHINSDGTLANWTNTTEFTTARTTHSSVVYNGYLYIIGGYSSAYLNDVQFGYINADGTIASWSNTTNLPSARGYHSAVVYNHYLYVIGGFNGSTALDEVLYAGIALAGSIGSWTNTTYLPAARWAHSSIAYNGHLYVIGGSSSSPYLNDVQFAPINANGTIGSWNATSSFAIARYDHTSVVFHGYLYILGGISPLYLNDVQYALINANGTVNPWNTTSSFNIARYGHTSSSYNSYLYVIGGYSNNLLNDVQFAHINPDGTLGSWVATSSFAIPRYYHSSVVYNGYVYIIGGYSTGYLSDVQYAHINADGTLGSWSNTTNLPTPRAFHTSVAYKGYLYVIGGYYPTYLNSVLYAPINADGTIGSWTQTTDLPTERETYASVVYNGYLYVIGGWDNNGALKDVIYAYINGDGSLALWFPADKLPEPRWGNVSIAYNGYLYVIGGYGDSGPINDVLSAPINSNGSIGAWNSTNKFQSPRYLHKAESYRGYLYLIGGLGSGNSFNDVQFTTMNGPAARAYYSKLLDTGSDQVLNSIRFNSTSYYTGVTNLTYAIAPSSTSIFGTHIVIPDAAAAITYTLGLGVCARYAWIRFDLDDTNSASIDGASLNGRKDLLDFTLFYNEQIAHLKPYQSKKPIVDDSASSKANGIIEPDENVNLTGDLENIGNADASSVNGILSTDDPIIITQNNAFYPDIAAGTHHTCITCYSLRAPKENRQSTHWDFNVSETISSTYACPNSYQYTYHIGESFLDVPVSNVFYSYIEKILHSGVASGCTTSTYCPSALVLRQQMAKFICVSMEALAPGTCGLNSCENIFTDVPASNIFCPYIEALYSQGLVSGCQIIPLMYCPIDTTQRQAMAKFICIAMEKVNPGSCVTNACAGLFVDVQANNPFCPYVEGVYNAGVVAGCGTNPLMYCPTNNVTRQQMAKFLVNAFLFAL